MEPLQYRELLERVPEWVMDEQRDSAYYGQLSTMAPTAQAREWMLEWSDDEASHALLMSSLYLELTGEPVPMLPVTPPNVPPYPQALRERIVAESGDVRKYSDAYLSSVDPRVRDIFFRLSVTEGYHALRLLLLRGDLCCGDPMPTYSK